MEKTKIEKKERKQLQNDLILIGLSGFAYTDLWNKKAKELNELK